MERALNASLYAEHSKSFRFYVIEPNDSVAINSIIESRDAIFDEHRFLYIPRPSQRSLAKQTKDIGYSVIPKEVTEEVVQQPEPKLRKSKRHRTPKDFRPEFELYLVKGTRDEVFDQHSYCFNVEDDPKTFDEAMKSQDIFKKKLKVDGNVEKFKARTNRGEGLYCVDWLRGTGARVSTVVDVYVRESMRRSLGIDRMDVKIDFLNRELEEEAPKQWHPKFDEVVLSNGYLLNQADKYVYSKFDASGKGVIICLYVDDMLIFGTDQVQVDLTKEFLSSRFSMKDMGEADVILLIGCLMYAMTCTRPDIAFAVGKLSRYTSNPSTQHWQAIQRISNTKDNSSTSGWVFLLGGGAIYWASKKQTCITGSIIESEFVALAAAGKEAE
ncbi:zinc finger, CCHC-type containing protein [Tanacetum coccineum]